MSRQTRVSIDRKAIYKAIAEAGEKACNSFTSIVAEEFKNELEETDRLHTSGDTLYTNFKIETEKLPSGLPRYYIMNTAPHAYMQEFGAPAHVVTVDEKMARYYGWEIGTSKLVYVRPHTEQHQGVSALHEIRYFTAQPSLARSILRAIPRFRGG